MNQFKKLLQDVTERLDTLIEETRKNRETFEEAIKVMQSWQKQDKHHHKRNEDKLDAIRKKRGG